MLPISIIRIKTLCGFAALAIAASLLSACGGGGGSGGGNSENQVPPATSNVSTTFTYTGPAPSSADVQRFQQAFYNNLVNDNRCGNCHTRGGAGKTAFVDRTDVNYAYSQALTLIDRDNPTASQIVEKVYGGHHCWVTESNAACRVQMTTYIENWLSDGTNASTSVKLTAPKDRDPNGGGNGFTRFPDLATYSSSALYQLVSNPNYCARCHSDTSTVKQQPFFGSSTPSVSYDAIQSKIDLNDPNIANPAKAKSRLVVRLRDEFHNCWSSSCANDAQTMSDDILSLQLNSPHIVLDSTKYRSQAQVLNDGVVGISAGRFESYQIALWRFIEGEGSVVSDTSGVSPSIDLTIKGTEGELGTFKWIGGGGIQFLAPDPVTHVGAVAYGRSSDSKKLYDLISASGEYSIEAWTVPANVADEGRDIIDYSDGTGNGDRSGRNFMLGQTMYNYDFSNRSSATNPLGEVNGKIFSSDPDLEALQANLQHVVATYDPVNGRRVYVDGTLVSKAFPGDKGTLGSDWSQNYAVVMGNILSGSEKTAWKGALRMVAIHKRALTPDQITQNFNVPPGEKRYVMFNVSKISNMPASCYDAASDTSYCYIYFEISQYDNYAYEFNKPYFISLNNDISDINNRLIISGIRIGINGQLSTEGQAYVNVNPQRLALNTANYVAGNSPGSGILLSSVGTVVPKSSGPDSDLMYLEFDMIGTSSNTPQTPVPTVLSFAYKLDGAVAIDMGWRTFDEINETFAYMTRASLGSLPMPNSAVTGKSDTQGVVTIKRVFDSVRPQLPAVEDFPAYLSSHQTAVTNLAISYCAALMRDPHNYWQTFFSVANANGLKASNWDALVNPLVDRFFSDPTLYTTSPVASPTVSAKTKTELQYLLTYYKTPSLDLNRNTGICVDNSGTDICTTDDQILNAATITCAAALANAAMTMQ